MSETATTALTGKALLQKVKELSHLPRRETAKRCGYYTVTKDNQTLISCGGDNSLKIYFESEANKREYLEIPVHGSDDMSGLKKIYDDMADNPNTGSIN